MREKKIDAIVALDDFDVEKVATFREEFRIPGMGLTTSRYFRDKLAMRVQARDAGIKVPAFTAIFNNDEVNHYADTVPGPWFLKPRSEASAMGIRKVNNKDELWQHIHELGDRRHGFLLEQFKPGDVYHTDSLTYNGNVEFCWVSRYLNTPYEVAHGSGIFRSQTLDQSSETAKTLKQRNADVMKAFGMRHSASHTEFIHCHEDGEFYFLETSSRVGGAHLATMVEHASGVNLWYEWARIEDAVAKKQAYILPEVKNGNAGILISLTRMEHPDNSVFSAPEIKWFMKEKYHVGFVLSSDNHDKIGSLLDEYAEVVFRDFHASAKLGEKPSH